MQMLRRPTRRMSCCSWRWALNAWLAVNVIDPWHWAPMLGHPGPSVEKIVIRAGTPVALSTVVDLGASAELDPASGQDVHAVVEHDPDVRLDVPAAVIDARRQVETSVPVPLI